MSSFVLSKLSGEPLCLEEAAIPEDIQDELPFRLYQLGQNFACKLQRNGSLLCGQPDTYLNITGKKAILTR